MNIEAEEVFRSFQKKDWMGAFEERKQFVRKYAWAVPNMAAINEIARHGKVVEIGAGSGYWAYLLREHGVDVVAYDEKPYENKWCNNIWTDIEKGDADSGQNHPNRTLFLCWPPYETPMAYDAVKAHMEAGGRKVIYIGEGYGGCTGDDDFHDLMETEYECISTVHIPQWYGIHDCLSIYQRIGG